MSTDRKMHRTVGISTQRGHPQSQRRQQSSSEEKFEEALQKFKGAYFREDEFDNQKTAMEEGKTKYVGRNIKKTVKCLYTINDMMALFEKGANKFSDKDMMKKVIPRNLSAQAPQSSSKTEQMNCMTNQISWLFVEDSKNSATSKQKRSKREGKIKMIVANAMPKMGTGKATATKWWHQWKHRESRSRNLSNLQRPQMERMPQQQGK